MKVELTKREVAQKLLSVVQDYYTDTSGDTTTNTIHEAIGVMTELLKQCGIDVNESRTSIRKFCYFTESYLEIAFDEIIKHCIVNDKNLSLEEQQDKIASVMAECFILAMQAIQSTSCVLETDFELFEYDETTETIKLIIE